MEIRYSILYITYIILFLFPSSMKLKQTHLHLKTFVTDIGRRQDFGEKNATKELGYRSSMVKDIGSSSSFSKNFPSFFNQSWQIKETTPHNSTNS